MTKVSENASFPFDVFSGAYVTVTNRHVLDFALSNSFNSVNPDGNPSSFVRIWRQHSPGMQGAIPSLSLSVCPSGWEGNRRPDGK